MSKNDFWFTPEEDAMKLFNAFKQRELGKYCAEAEEKGIKIGKQDGIKQVIKNLFRNGMKPEDIIRVTDIDKNTVDMALKEI